MSVRRIERRWQRGRGLCRPASVTRRHLSSLHLDPRSRDSLVTGEINLNLSPKTLCFKVVPSQTSSVNLPMTKSDEGSTVHTSYVAFVWRK